MTHHNFYDTETTGANPRFDQVLQAAAILTDDDFMEIDWLDERSRLAGHIVPSAGALKVTHVDPYEIARAKYSAYEFARMLHGTFSSWKERSGGELAYNGFNTIRFDEEIMRQMFWENLLDPYITSGKGVYRSDLLTVIRALYARNPECFEVPKREDGKNNFRLENLAPLNGFEGHNAHDALGDVRATIFVAQMIRDTDLALWEHMLAMGNAANAKAFIEKNQVFRLLGGPMLDPGILDVCLIATEAANDKNKYAWNLAVDPTPYLDLPPAEILAAMQQSGTPFRSIKANKQPAAFPMGWEFLSRVSNENFEPADPATIEARAGMILEHEGFQANVAEAMRLKAEGYGAPETLEEKIYSGFPDWEDKNRMKSFHETPDWSRRLDISRGFRKAELRSLGIRSVYLNAPEVLPEMLRTACAERIAEDRHCLAIDKPWTTVGTLMKEVDEFLAANPECPEALNIRAWALETYPAAREWKGIEALEQQLAEAAAANSPAADGVEGEPVLSEADPSAEQRDPGEPRILPEGAIVCTPAERKPGVVVPTPAQVAEASVHFLDGLV